MMIIFGGGDCSGWTDGSEIGYMEMLMVMILFLCRLLYEEI
jgi:hypothetical protein